MSNVELWTYISYGIAALFFLGACYFAALIYISSQNNKKNPIALPTKARVVETKKEAFDGIEEDFSLQSPNALPSRRNRGKVAPTMHEPTGNLKSSKNFFEDDDFKLTGGTSK